MGFKHIKNTKRIILKNFNSTDDAVNYLQKTIKKFYDLKIDINDSKFVIRPNYFYFSSCNYVVLNGEIKFSDNLLFIDYYFVYTTEIFIPAIAMFFLGEIINIAIANQINSTTILLAMASLFLPLIFCLSVCFMMKKEQGIINDFIKYIKHNLELK